jgi:hypothetical protein
MPCEEVDALFGIAKTPSGRLRVIKFHDKNANGVKDPGEEYLAGFKFNVTWTDTMQSYSVSTDYNGYGILSLPIGTYSVEEIDGPAGYVGTTPVKVEGLQITEGRETDVSFGNKKVLGSLTVLKTDQNGNPMPGFLFDVSTGGSTIFDGARTGPDGKLAWTGLNLGTYRITERFTDDWETVGPRTQEVALTIDGPDQTVVFKNKRKGGDVESECANLAILKEIVDMKEGDSLQGWVFNIIGPEFPDGFEVSTDTEGRYSADCIEPGTYIVSENPPEGWSLDESTSSPQTKDATLGETALFQFKNKKIPPQLPPIPQLPGPGGPCLCQLLELVDTQIYTATLDQYLPYATDEYPAYRDYVDWVRGERQTLSCSKCSEVFGHECSKDECESIGLNFRWYDGSTYDYRHCLYYQTYENGALSPTARCECCVNKDLGEPSPYCDYCAGGGTTNNALFFWERVAITRCSNYQLDNCARVQNKACPAQSNEAASSLSIADRIKSEYDCLNRCSLEDTCRPGANRIAGAECQAGNPDYFPVDECA